MRGPINGRPGVPSIQIAETQGTHMSTMPRRRSAAGARPRAPEVLGVQDRTELRVL